MWALKLQGNHCTIHAVYVRRTHMVQSLSFLAVQTESEDSSKVILETFDQSDGETWPDQQKDEDKYIKRPNNCCGLTIERDTGASMQNIMNMQCWCRADDNKI